MCDPMVKFEKMLFVNIAIEEVSRNHLLLRWSQCMCVVKSKVMLLPHATVIEQNDVVFSPNRR